MPALVAATFYIGVAMAVTWRISEYEEEGATTAGPGSDRGTPLPPPATARSPYAYPGALCGGCVAKQGHALANSARRLATRDGWYCVRLGGGGGESQCRLQGVWLLLRGKARALFTLSGVPPPFYIGPSLAPPL